MTRMIRLESDIYRLDLGDDWMAETWRKTPLEAPKTRKSVVTPQQREREAREARHAEERRRARRVGEMPAHELIAIRERYCLSWTRMAQIMGGSISSLTSYAKSGPVPAHKAKKLRAWVEAGAPGPAPKRKPEPVRKPTPPPGPVAHSDEVHALLKHWQITPRDLADKLGVSQAAASAWISGRREISPTRRRQIVAWLS